VALCTGRAACSLSALPSDYAPILSTTPAIPWFGPLSDNYLSGGGSCRCRHPHRHPGRALSPHPRHCGSAPAQILAPADALTTAGGHNTIAFVWKALQNRRLSLLTQPLRVRELGHGCPNGEHLTSYDLRPACPRFAFHYRCHRAASRASGGRAGEKNLFFFFFSAPKGGRGPCTARDISGSGAALTKTMSHLSAVCLGISANGNFSHDD